MLETWSATSESGLAAERRSLLGGGRTSRSHITNGPSDEYEPTPTAPPPATKCHRCARCCNNAFLGCLLWPDPFQLTDSDIFQPYKNSRGRYLIFCLRLLFAVWLLIAGMWSLATTVYPADYFILRMTGWAYVMTFLYFVAAGAYSGMDQSSPPKHNTAMRKIVFLLFESAFAWSPICIVLFWGFYTPSSLFVANFNYIFISAHTHGLSSLFFVFCASSMFCSFLFLCLDLFWNKIEFIQSHLIIIVPLAAVFIIANGSYIVLSDLQEAVSSGLSTQTAIVWITSLAGVVAGFYLGFLVTKLTEKGRQTRNFKSGLRKNRKEGDTNTPRSNSSSFLSIDEDDDDVQYAPRWRVEPPKREGATKDVIVREKSRMVEEDEEIARPNRTSISEYTPNSQVSQVTSFEFPPTKPTHHPSIEEEDPAVLRVRQVQSSVDPHMDEPNISRANSIIAPLGSTLQPSPNIDLDKPRSGSSLTLSRGADKPTEPTSPQGQVGRMPPGMVPRPGMILRPGPRMNPLAVPGRPGDPRASFSDYRPPPAPSPPGDSRASFSDYRPPRAPSPPVGRPGDPRPSFSDYRPPAPPPPPGALGAPEVFPTGMPRAMPIRAGPVPAQRLITRRAPPVIPQPPNYYANSADPPSMTTSTSPDYDSPSRTLSSLNTSEDPPFRTASSYFPPAPPVPPATGEKSVVDEEVDIDSDDDRQVYSPTLDENARMWNEREHSVSEVPEAPSPPPQ